MGIGQLVSGLTVRQGAPWAVVGEAAINLAPPPVKNFAISAFGSNDKNVLVAGILVVLAIFAAVVGVLALRRLAYGYLGLAIFAAVGVAAAISLPKANLGWAAPTVFGALVAAFFLTKLTQRALDATATPRRSRPRPRPRPGRSSPPGRPRTPKLTLATLRRHFRRHGQPGLGVGVDPVRQAGSGGRGRGLVDAP